MKPGEIAQGTAPLFRHRDDLARRLAIIDGMLDSARRAYSVADGLCVPVRPEAFRRHCAA